MTPPALKNMAPARQRALAAALLVGAILLLLIVVLGPIVLLHRHYDEAIADTSDRLRRYQRVAAQAPGLRVALDAMQQRDGRRFFLKNTATNLAGAELQELVKAAIEATAAGSRPARTPVPVRTADFARSASTCNSSRRRRSCRNPAGDRDAPAVPDRRKPHDAAAQRVPRVQARARTGAGAQHPARRRRMGVSRAGQSRHAGQDDRDHR